MANLLVMLLVVATAGCMAETQAPHFWQGVSSTTGGGAGRGWQVLVGLHESWPERQVQICVVMLAEHIGLAASLQSTSL
jgi:hypothetical protein